MPPEGQVEGDDDSLPDEQGDDEDDTCAPQNIWKARSEDLGDTDARS